MRRFRELTAEEENFRLVSSNGITRIRRDSVEPEPVGTLVACMFRITGYDQDCDGSLMARLTNIDFDGESTGWEQTNIGGLAEDAVVLDSPVELKLLCKEA